MKNFVITIQDNERSVKAAKSCIRSAAYYGLQVEMFDAITPKDNLEELLRKADILPIRFEEKYSRTPNAIAAFLSHYSLWKKCVEDDEEYTIFEHDAIVVDNIPENLYYYSVINLGKPSYGKWNQPSLGVGMLTSKEYFPGAHAYRLKPEGAQALINVAPYEACPTDLYLHHDRFPFLEEYYPWPVEAKDTFTTIQKVEGCKAKHNYNERYEII
jgi:glycosyl transferase family 25